MSHVIAAVSTGKLVSAIGILRLSGDGAIQVASQVFRGKNNKPLDQAPNHKMVLGQLLDEDGNILDEILAVVARGPHSYTGEDTVELQCHGSPAVLVAGLEALFHCGARSALPGEFTKRAFLNGNLDLTQAEAVIDLIEAETAEAARNAAGQLGGSIFRKIHPLYDNLTGICSHFHAVLDYPDEDIPAFTMDAFKQTIGTGANDLGAMLSTFGRGQILKSGIGAVILGKPNAGKSSLLNALAGFDRVIVTDTAGTTRDAVTERVMLGSLLLRLTDTAGIRDSSDEIEQMGVVIAEKAATQADLAICVFDGSRPLSPEDYRVIDTAEQAGVAIAVINKSDLPQAFTPSDLPFDMIVPVCAKTGDGLDLLSNAAELCFPEGDIPCDGSMLTNARQAEAVARAQTALNNSMQSLALHMTPDAVLVDVEEAMLALGEITGRTMREDITREIFSRFCVGK